MKTDFIVVLVTCGSKVEAEKIVDALLGKRLIACANIISGIESKFWWKGKIDKAKETLVMLKTRKKHFRRIEKEVKRLHNYEVPELIALPTIAISEGYLYWLKSCIVS